MTGILSPWKKQDRPEKVVELVKAMPNFYVLVGLSLPYTYEGL